MICETVPKDPAVIVDLGDMEESPKVGEYLQHCPCCLWFASVLVTPVCLSLLLIDPRVFSSLSSHWWILQWEYHGDNWPSVSGPALHSHSLSRSDGARRSFIVLNTSHCNTFLDCHKFCLAMRQSPGPDCRSFQIEKLSGQGRARAQSQPGRVQVATSPWQLCSQGGEGAGGWLAVANVPLPQHCHRHSPHSPLSLWLVLKTCNILSSVSRARGDSEQSGERRRKTPTWMSESFTIQF